MDNKTVKLDDHSENEKVGLLKSNSLDNIKKIIPNKEKKLSIDKNSDLKIKEKISDIIKFNNDGPESPSVYIHNIEKSLTRVAAQNTSIRRKQIHFNLDNRSANQSKNSIETSIQVGKELQEEENKRKLSDIHQKLNQIKIDELKRKNTCADFTSVSNRRKKKENKTNFSVFIDSAKRKVHVFRTKFYNFFERPIGKLGFVYRIFTFTLILASIITGTLTTLDSLNSWSFKFFFYFEIFVTAFFGFEFFVRVWSSAHRTTYNGILGRVKFMSKILHVLEFLMLLITSSFLFYIGYHFDYYKNGSIFSSYAMTWLRLIQIFRFLYIDRRAQTWKLLMKVVHKHRFELLTSVYIGIFILLFSSYFILIFEKEFPDNRTDFHSYADAVYWSIITMTTIGYGDRSPKTFYGKIIATGLCIVGVAFWTLPGGIIGSGFALKVEQKNKQKQFNRLLPAATSLIQAWWRMKVTLVLSTSKSSCLAATISTFDLSKPLYSSSLRRLQKHLDPSMNAHNEYFSNLDSPDSNKNVQKQPEIECKNKTHISKDTYSNNSNNFNFSLNSFSENDSSVLLQLSPEHLILIRTILLLRYWAARQKFKLAFKPYDFKDVIDQYTQGNMDIMLKMKDLQRKIERVSAQNAIPIKFNKPSIFESLTNSNSNLDQSYSTKESPSLSRNMNTKYPDVPSPFLEKKLNTYSKQLSIPSEIKRVPSRSRQLSLTCTNRNLFSNLDNNPNNPSSIRSRHSSLNSTNKNVTLMSVEYISDKLVTLELEITNVNKKLDKILQILDKDGNKE